MSTIPERPTPETDAETFDIARHGADGTGSRVAVVHYQVARRLERERDAARAEIEAMREVVAAAENCRHWHDCLYNPETGKTEGVVISADGFWELHDAIAKLQPFIKP